jgi:hypothetical protein
MAPVRDGEAAMSSSLTIFTTCKPFVGSAAVRQRNALESWRRIRPAPEVLVFGAEAGVAEACAGTGARAIPELGRSASGAPLLPSLVLGAERAASGSVLALVNADILLTSAFPAAVDAVAKAFDHWLLIARRWNLPLDAPFDFGTPDWEDRLIDRARAEGRLEAPFGGVDAFAFPRGLWGDEPLPSFAVGRGRWDSGILFQARRRGIAVVDATPVATVVHPDHDYGHHPQGRAGVFDGPDARENERLLGGAAFVFSALNATHVLYADGLRPNRVRNPMHALRRLATLPALDPRLRSLRPVIAAAAPAWRGLRRLTKRVGRP